MDDALQPVKDIARISSASGLSDYLPKEERPKIDTLPIDSHNVWLVKADPEPEDPRMAQYGDEWYGKGILPPGQPLPPPGEPYHKAWGGMWDYYGYFLFGKQFGVDRPEYWEYNCSLDNLFNEWTPYLLEVLGGLKKKYHEKHSGAPEDHFIAMSDFAVPIFNKLYGGFTFAPFMKMIKSSPTTLDAKLKEEFEKIFQEAFNKLLSDFVARRGITIDQIPTREIHEESSMTAMRDVLRRHMEGGQSMDYSDKLDYSIGMELKDGRIFEKSAYALYLEWSMSNSIKDIAIASAGLRIKMEEMQAGRKMGRIMSWLLKKQLEMLRKRIRGWGVRAKDKDGKEVRFDIRDVAMFYPPPHSGLGPVKNPVR